MAKAKRIVALAAAAGTALTAACAPQGQLNMEATQKAVSAFSPSMQRNPMFAAAAQDCAVAGQRFGERPASDDRNLAVGIGTSMLGGAAAGAGLGAMGGNAGYGTAAGAITGLLIGGAMGAVANEKAKEARAQEVYQYVQECIAQAMGGGDGSTALSVLDSRQQRRATQRVQETVTVNGRVQHSVGGRVQLMGLGR